MRKVVDDEPIMYDVPCTGTFINSSYFLKVIFVESTELFVSQYHTYLSFVAACLLCANKTEHYVCSCQCYQAGATLGAGRKNKHNLNMLVALSLSRAS